MVNTYAHPSINYPEFNHYTPAAYLLANGDEIKGKLTGFKKALDRFEKLFADINKFLPDTE